MLNGFNRDMRATNALWIISLTALLATACTADKKKRDHDGQAQYKTMTVGRTSQTLTSAYTARLTGRQIVEIRPQVAGNITRICINEGQHVEKGQTLFVIDQVPYQAALEAAKAAVEKLNHE